MKQVINIAIDLETLSLESDAAIGSIAAVPFNPNVEVFNDYSVFQVIPEGATEPLSEFYEVVNATSCALQGMHIDMETVKWWSCQKPEAKAELLSRQPLNIGEAMNAFHNYVEGMKRAYDADIVVWAQGADFDFPKIRNAYNKCLNGVNRPWGYRDVRDARSIVLDGLEMMYGREEKPYDRIPECPTFKEELKHSALYDARRTAWSVANVRNMICRSISEAHTSATTPQSSE